MNLERAKSIDGWMSDDELQFLARTASSSNLIIEFGCYKGRSTRALADNTNGVVIAVDPWLPEYYNEDSSRHGINPDVYPEFYRNLKDHVDSGKVIPIITYSHKLEWDGARPDFIFLDGDHRTESVRKDIKIALALLPKGSILAGHDYEHPDWPGVKKAVDEFFPNVNLVNSIWWVYV